VAIKDAQKQRIIIMHVPTPMSQDKKVADMSEEIIKAPDGPYEFWTPKEPYDIIVIRDKDMKDIFRITHTGDIFWRPTGVVYA